MTQPQSVAAALELAANKIVWTGETAQVAQVLAALEALA